MESLKEKDSLQHIKLEAIFSWKNLFINTLKKGRSDSYETEIYQLKNLRNDSETCDGVLLMKKRM